MDREELRAKVLRTLEEQGFQVEGGVILSADRSKDEMRRAHARAVEVARRAARPSLERFEDRFVAELARTRPDPADVQPRLDLVPPGASHEARLWRWISLHWSIPISGGYGRRMRFIVRDQANEDAVIGIIGLTDPVFSLRARDSWIGWNVESRKERLVHVMEAYALGAVAPYDSMLGGKLVAMLAASSDVRAQFAEKYQGAVTRIRERSPEAMLWAVTTQSAFGRSALYNRLSAPDGDPLWIRLGETRGSGDFHFAGELYEDLAKLAVSLQNGERPSGSDERWKRSGFRNRKDVLHAALAALEFDPRYLRLHGIPRGVYIAPFASNVCDVLSSAAEAETRVFSVDEIAEHWKSRWGPNSDGRASSSRDSWRLFPRSV